MITKRSFTLIFVFSLFTLYNSFSQTVLNDKLIKVPSLVEVRHLDNPFFKEYFEVYIEQPINHDDPKSEKFKQRFCVGYNGLDVPNIMDLDGYGIDYAARKGYIDELSKTLKCNLVTVEHRYFGKSVPKKVDWKYLTMKQAANDYHTIKIVLETMMKGKWLVTGTGKGGQSALAYKMYYPKDVEGAIVIGTPVRKDAADKRLMDFITKQSQTECGKKVIAYQQQMLKRKKALLPLFQKFTVGKNMTFGKREIETIFEYSVLFYQFCFYQNCTLCDEVPSDTASDKDLLKALFDVANPKFFSEENKQRSDASFYMFYNELGNYEYDLTPFAGLLRNKKYPNSIFCPADVEMDLDETYLESLNTFVQKEMTKSIFICGDKDPMISLQPEVKTKLENYKYIVANGCTKIKISNLDPKQTKELQKSLYAWLGCKFPEEKK